MATAVIRKEESLTAEQQTAQLTARYAGSLIHRALIQAGEPLKASEVVKAVGRQDVDLKLARVALSTNAQITAVDRRWTLWSRYFDSRATVDATIRRLLDTYGQPMRISELATELRHVFGRPVEVYEELVQRLATMGTGYLTLGGDYIIPAHWMLDVEPEADDEVQFENFLDDADVEPFEAHARTAALASNSAASITDFLNRADGPVKGLAMQFLAWKANRTEFSAAEMFETILTENCAVPLSGGYWIGPAVAERLAGNFAELSEQEVSENAEAEAQEAAKPLNIGEAELQQLVEAVQESDGTVHASDLLADTFDVTPDYRTYDEDLATIIRSLAGDERVVWVGSDRFRPQGTIPAYVFTVPALLDIPTYNFLDADGLPMDQLLEDDGFNGGLERDIVNPLAQDVLDEEPVPEPDHNPPSNARAVIKYHHKQIGTMPLCQFPSGFFPAEPEILETEFVLPTGQRTQVWVNNSTRLLYGLIDWFQMIPIDSGATFTLERQSPDRFVINYNDESEPAMFVSRNRVNELFALQERAEAESLSTFDVMREIMEHYRKGIEFITLHTEINIVRRVTRRLVASLLSEYHCVFQRGGAWVYDPKKLPLGFDKSKRKFLVK